MEDAEGVEFPPREKAGAMILVMGETGAGKSHFINKVAGREVAKESARLKSCTKKPQVIEVRVGDNEFLMVDTPGFNDTWRDSSRSDGKILTEISRTLSLQTQLGVKLVSLDQPQLLRVFHQLTSTQRGILFLYDIRAARMTGDKRRQIEMIKRVCGQQNFGSVLLVTTHWPASYEEQIEQGCGVREADLRSDFWKEMIKGGSKMIRFYDTQDSAQAIVAGLAGMPNISLALQDELAAGKRLDDTGAAAYIINARQEDEELLKRLRAQRTPSASNTTTIATADDDIAQLQESVDSRKTAEPGLRHHPIAQVRKEIHQLMEAARQQRRKMTTADVFRCLVSVSELTVQLIQTIFSAS